MVASHNSTETDLDFLVETLQNASLTRDFDVFEQLLEPYFEADFSFLPEVEQAYLNYFLGYYFVHLGKSQNIANAQEKGKDYLTNAVDLFEKTNLSNEAIEAQISLGWADYQTGVIQNYEAYLFDALSQCQPYSEAYFSVNVSLLIVYYKKQIHKEAFKIVEDLEPKLLYCQNLRILCQFYNNAGLIYRDSGNTQKAIEFFESGISCSKSLKNKQFEGQTLNCLANLYLRIEQYKTGLNCAELALEIFKHRNEKGFIANVLDTKALLQSANGELNEALSTINAALTYFREGESFLDFAECLWNKIEILEKLKKKDSMIETFTELSAVGILHLDLTAQRSYQQKFADKIIVPFGETYDEKLLTFQKEVILPVVESAKITHASRQLGFRSRQNLQNLIKRQNLKGEPNQTDIFPISKPSSLKQNLGNVKFYQVPKRSAQYLQINSEIIIAVVKQNGFYDGDLVLIQNHELFLGEITIEDNKPCFIDLSGNTITDKNARWVGRVIGYAKAGSSEFVFI